MTFTAVSFINMKGGVGKSTLAFNLACYAAKNLGRKVLAVDLDPQANLSQYFMGYEGYATFLEEQRPTVADVLEGYQGPTQRKGAPKPIDVPDVVVPIERWWSHRIHLLPSRLELSWALREPQGKDTRLASFLAQAADEYDLVIIDCAPTESVLTKAAYRTSRYLIVPVRPEFFATVGFPLLKRSLDEYKAGNQRQSLDVAGIVFNGMRRTNTPPEQRQAMRDVIRSARAAGWPVFQNIVHHSDSFPAGARHGTPISLTLNSRSNVISEFNAVAAEFAKAIHLV